MLRLADGQIEELVRAPVLLVAVDFDGVLAPIAPRPGDARLDDEAGRALRELTRMERTSVVIISGRALDDLRGLTAACGAVYRVGSHGAEQEGSPPPVLSAVDRATLREMALALDDIAARTAGALVERKPLSVVLHVRLCEENAGHAALAEAAALAAERPQVRVRPALMALELTLSPADKGAALLGIRQRVAASAVLFMGDDETDEHGFAVLQRGDLGIKVGAAPTRAGAVLDDQREVAPLLARLGGLRRAWLDRQRAVPIERHAFLSDQRTLALVDPRGRVVWMCFPRADGSATFAELLGGEEKGYFAIESADAGEERPRQEYTPGSFVLRTRWRGVTVTDYLDTSSGRAYQRAGRSDLMRVIESTGGAARVKLTFAPRPDFGRLSAQLIVHENALEVEGASDPLVLWSPGVVWTITKDGAHETATAEVEVGQTPLVLELRCGFAGRSASRQAEPERRAQTERFWSGWARTLTLPNVHTELVLRSALALKALVYGPTGAVYAAGTTSLPEHLGGVRNWDYRYCWPRDACLAAAALLRLGNTGVAMKLLDWIVSVVAASESPDRLRPLYSVAGHAIGPEAEIGELPGYAQSRPVRVGNAADQQVQLDVFGPIVDLAAGLVERGAPVTPEHWRLVEAMAGAVAARWTEPDHGIWEVRGPRRHHVHTKAMCWLAIDRALVVAREVQGRDRADWLALREAIGRDVLAHGWSEAAQSYVFAYGTDDLDAAALWVGLSGLLPADDERFVATVRAVERGLADGPVVYRYRLDDGLPGVEGGFHICTSWLIEALDMIGERDRARRLLDQFAALAGPTGLLAEQYDPQLGVALGNYPQAYSHLGLINAAVRLGGKR
ncbi:MAG: trehalose-phosphatase [Planctomycetota bacterium]|nr:trehalose-phosphatase [Planctomycetota bacterium]